MKKYTFDEIEHYKVQGRTAGRREYVPLFWTGAALEVNVSGTELWAEIECKWNEGESYVRCEVDGACVLRQMLADGKNNICIYRNFGDAVKNVRIFRETQASGTTFKIISLSTDGEFSPLPERKRIEFLGDSVTSGEGLIGSKCHTFWAPGIFGTKGNYAILTADALGADYSIVSRSGWGIYCSYNNIILNNIPRYYEYVAATAPHPDQKAMGACELYDFAAHPAAVTVINLGANDAGAFKYPEWVAPDGTVYKQRMEPDNTFNKEDVRKVYDAVIAFCKKIRSYRPDTEMVWCYNMLGGDLNATITDAVAEYSASEGDTKVHTVKLPRLTPELRFAHNHPGTEAHAMFAEALIPEVRKLL